VAIIGGMWLAASYFPSGNVERLNVEQILEPLDAGEPQQARQQAMKLRTNPELTEEHKSACSYVLGMVVVADAEAAAGTTQQRLLYLIAAKYLDQSRQLDFPRGREPAGLLMLGRAQYRAGRYPLAIAALTEALTKNPDSTVEIEQALTDCLLKSEPPQIAAALEHIDRLLRIPGLSPRQRDEAHLLAANIYFRAGDLAACEEALKQVLEGSSLFPQAQALAARVVLTQLPGAQRGKILTDAEKRPLQSLLAQLKPLADQRGLERDVAAQLDLLLAVVQERLNDTSEASRSYSQIRKVHHGSPEALAATFYEAEWLLTAGHVEESLSLFRRALQDAGPSEVYQNLWLPRAEVQRRIEAALRRYQELKSFESAQSLAQASVALLPRSQALLWQAEVERAWSADLLTHVGNLSHDERELIHAQSRAHLREAASRDRDIAQERIATRNYPDDLLRSANTFLQGHGYEQAEQTFRLFLQQQTREGQPEALLGLGQAQLALGRTSEALVTLGQVAALYEKHPANYQARLLSAAALQEQGELAAARELLSANLFNSALTPQSAEWRDSLFALGRVQFRQGLVHAARSQNVPPQETIEKNLAEAHRELETSFGYFDEAIKTLTEATQRFPNAPQYTVANYEAAEAYRHSAKWPRLRLATVSIDSTRQALNRQMNNDLSAAVAEYTRLIERLADEQESSRAAVDLKILRNCYFNRADALFDLGHYEEAIQAYSAATNRYQHEPEALEAYVQIANCYRRLQRYAEARGTLEQARVVLERIRKDADFAKTTRFDRQQWAELLLWYSNL
jgi:tetratricopeptide (TPR) repeat protein